MRSHGHLSGEILYETSVVALSCLYGNNEELFFFGPNDITIYECIATSPNLRGSVSMRIHDVILRAVLPPITKMENRSFLIEAQIRIKSCSDKKHCISPETQTLTT